GSITSRTATSSSPTPASTPTLSGLASHARRRSHSRRSRGSYRPKAGPTPSREARSPTRGVAEGPTLLCLSSMQLPLPLATDERPLRVVRHRRARRYILRVLDDGTVRVTVPRGGSNREA